MSAIFDSMSEPVANRATAGLAKIALVLRGNAWKGAGAAKVTPTQGEALALLHDAPGGMRLGEIARALAVSPPTASDTMNTLVAKGMVRKEPGMDKRSVSLVLTDAGRELATRARDWPAFLVEAVSTLEPDEQTQFLRTLVKLVRTLQENGDIAHQRMCVTCEFFRPYAYNDEVNPHHCAYVDAPFGDRHLRLACPEQVDAPPEQREVAWQRFIVSQAD